ncbi:MAG: motility associated factor glycosyltransferase family protein [Deltaproteobacteria bacterium]|nr:motility associated factor glycosyltransferase family protein [Deltaproteobacteria bacterium]
MPSDRVTVGVAKSGAPCLTLNGRPLSSSLDPVAEAESWAASLALDEVDVLVLFGLGLGYHVEALRRRTEVPIVVFEPSAAVRDAALAREGRELGDTWVAESADALRAHLGMRLQARQRVTAFSWPPSRRLYPELHAATIDATRRAVEVATVTANTLETRLHRWFDHLLANLPLVVGRVPARALASYVAGRPAIVVAAGPSLKRNVELLREVGERAVIVAVNTSLRALERAGVRAHLVVALELLDVSQQLADLELNRECPRAVSMTANPALIANAPGPVFPLVDRLPFFAPTAEAAGLGRSLGVGGSVANAAFSLARELGAPRIVLLGQDLAYTGGEAYAPGTVFEKMRVAVEGGRATLSALEAKRAIAASCPQADTTREVEEVEQVTAWGGAGTVPTTGAFNYFRYIFEEWAAEQHGLELVNATEGGARIAGFSERPFADVLAELPPPRPVPLPTEPRIRAEDVRRALEAEAVRVARARDEARSACQLGTPQAVFRMRQAICAAGLLYAYSWRTMCDTVRDTSLGLDVLCSRLADDAEATLLRLREAVAVL